MRNWSRESARARKRWNWSVAFSRRLNNKEQTTWPCRLPSLTPTTNGTGNLRAPLGFSIRLAAAGACSPAHCVRDDSPNFDCWIKIRKPVTCFAELLLLIIHEIGRMRTRITYLVRRFATTVTYSQAQATGPAIGQANRLSQPALPKVAKTQSAAPGAALDSRRPTCI